MADYDLEAQADAAEELAPIAQGGSGQIVTLTTPGAGVVDAATDTVTNAGDLVQKGSGLEITSRAQTINGTVIIGGDKVFLLSSRKISGQLITAPVPDQTTILLANDPRQWAIKAVDTLAPAGRPIMHTLLLRRP